MESRIVVTPRGDFGHDWNLIVETNDGVKNFYLGQDVKFCSRVLGLTPREIVHEIGTGDFRNEENLKLKENINVITTSIYNIQLYVIYIYSICHIYFIYILYMLYTNILYVIYVIYKYSICHI